MKEEEMNFKIKQNPIKTFFLLVSTILLCLLCLTTVAQSSDDDVLFLKKQIKEFEKRISAMEKQNKTNAPHKGTSRKIFEYHGYMRTGAGVNAEGGDQEVYKAPGASAKYRLGNENDHYGEFALVNNWLPSNHNHNAFFKTYLMVSYGSNQNANTDEDNWFKLPQAYVQAGNVISSMPEIKFWVGNRYYRRHDIHINDYFYLNMSGHGGGVEDINIGLGKLAIACLVGSNESEPYYKLNNVGRIAKKSIDIRLYDIDLPFGSGIFQLCPSWVKGGYYEIGTVRQKFDDTSGFGVSFFYKIDEFLGGTVKFGFQAGSGSGYDFSSHIKFKNPEDGEIDVNDKRTYRLTNEFAIKPLKKLSMMSAFIYEKRDTGAQIDSGETWVSFGVRPIIHFTDYISLAFEGGIDWTDIEKTDISGSLIKFTVAPQIQVPGNAWARPVLRAFATFASWSDEFEGEIAPDAYAKDTSGLSLGIQLESWW